VHLAKSRFFPDAWINGSAKVPLLAVETKKLYRQHKARFKEALAQALVYSTQYKAVLVVLVDCTPDAIYRRVFGPGNRVETRFATFLRNEHRIHVIVR
jgi:hypothetical protein